jgi:serine/threonine kinase 38
MNEEEKRVAAKQSLEAKYTRVNKLKEDRELRKQNLRAKMEEMQLDPEKQQQAEVLHNRTETEHLRAQRLKLSVADFEQLDIIGRGAFGEVRLCREKTSRNIYAMKKLKKAEMVLKGQVRAVHTTPCTTAQSGSGQAACAVALHACVCASRGRGRCSMSMQSWR